MEKTIAIFLPPLPQLSGGMLVLLQLGNYLASSGHKVNFVIHDGEIHHMGYAEVYDRAKAPIVSWANMQLTSEHVWIVPDGWTNAIVMGVRANARCVVYMQNWGFALRSLPDGVLWKNLPVDFLYVSEPVRRCLLEITGKDGPILRPGIDQELFYPLPKAHDAPMQESIRIAWMPRKNKILGEQIQDAVYQRMTRLYPHIRVRFVPIQRVAHDEVGNILRACHIFLITGYPEGCPLPPLEAMACGCVPVGFNGLGGWDYMRQFELPETPMPYLAKPYFELQERSFDGNGFYVEDAHVLAATLALEQAILLVHGGGEKLVQLQQNMQRTVMAYSLQEQQKNIEALASFLLK